MPSPYADDQEPEYRCAHCARLLYQDELARYACRVCETRAGEQIRELGTLYGRLASVLAPGAAPSGGGRVTASKTAPLPVALQPLSLRGPGGIVGELQVIEDAWRKELRFTIAPFRGSAEQTLPHVIKFLTNNVGWACDKYESVPDDLDTISRLHSQAKNTVDGTRPRLIPVVCRYLYDDGSECGERLRIDINRNVARCRTCGTRWGREEWVALYEATRENAA